MWEKLNFYTHHSLNDLRVNGQRTLFALLCIAAGVAAIVSLQTLGVMIEDTLTGSLQESNRGDIRIQFDYDASDAAKDRGETQGVLSKSDLFGEYYITPSGLGTIQTWFESNFPGQIEITYQQIADSFSAGMSLSVPERDTQKTFVAPYIIEADRYPFYGTRESEDGTPLAEMLQGPNDIVFSRNLADDLGAEVGDTISMSGASENFTLRGIVDTSEEGGFENVEGALFGYYYIDVNALSLLDDITPGAGTIYVKLEDPSQLDRINTAFENRFSYLETFTTDDLEEQNTTISDALNQLVVVMGLVSLLLGGIGIVNTMLVIVSRRTTEVAVLKTIGLEGEQVTVLFLVEAVLMGIVGSLLGIVLGWIAAYAIKGVAEGFLAQSLTFRITLAPALTGFVVGVVVTTIFGFLPTLAAGQVRPSLVLRPSDTVVPKAGRSRSFVALIFVMIAVSVVAQALTRDLLADDQLRSIAQIVGAVLGVLVALAMLAGGILSGWTRGKLSLRILRWVLIFPGLPLVLFLFAYGVPALLILFVTFIQVGMLYVLLWIIIWLVGRFFPTWRFVDLKIALRSMLATKGRNASTLVALVIGVFTLSLITMLATAISNRFEELLVDEVGGNVIVFAAGQNDTLQQVETRLDSFEGVREYAAVGTYNASLIEAEDVSAGQTLRFAQLEQRARREQGEMADTLAWWLDGIDARGVESNLPDVTFYDGRQLSANDTGPWSMEDGDYPPIVISVNEATLATGLEVGDLLTFELEANNTLGFGVSSDPQRLTFEIVGMVDRTGANLSINFGSMNYAPLAAFPPDSAPDMVSAVVDIEESQIRDLRQSLNEMPGVFVLETKLLNDLINRIIDQFTSFPILVAGLALVVGGIVIANSVALSTLERRREIAIMKAVGLQRERVLGMLLLEYGLMGLIGGLIGVGIGGLILLYMLTSVFGGEMGNSIPYMTALSLMGLCVLIAVAAAILTAWTASGEKPLNVLRYE